MFDLFNVVFGIGNTELGICESTAQPIYKFLTNNFIFETIMQNGLFDEILSIVSGLGAEGEESLFVPTPLLGPFFLSN